MKVHPLLEMIIDPYLARALTAGFCADLEHIRGADGRATSHLPSRYQGEIGYALRVLRSLGLAELHCDGVGIQHWHSTEPLRRLLQQGQK